MCETQQENSSSFALVSLLFPGDWHTCPDRLHGHFSHTPSSAATRLPPALPSALLSLHFMTVPLFLASLCLMKTICKFLQIYVPILSKFISRLYSVSLFFPLGEWPHHTPHSWNRSHLQSQNVFTNSNTSCLLWRSNTRSFLREAVEWSCPAHPTPAVFLSPHTVLNCGCACAEPLMCEGGVWWNVCKLISR